MSYSHMGRPHTTIGAEQFHFRVRDGIGWVTFAMVTKQTGMHIRQLSSTYIQILEMHSIQVYVFSVTSQVTQYV